MTKNGEIISVELCEESLSFTFADDAQKKEFETLGENWVPDSFVTIFYVASIPHIDGVFYVKKGMPIYDVSFTIKSDSFLGSTTFHFKVTSPINGYLKSHHRSMIAHYGEELFTIEAHDNIEELLNAVRQEKVKQKLSESVKEDEACFVYVMEDTANGYHKIGISNNPKYREHTLQSEKPSIELLFAKKFPTRKMAEALESSLHKVYESKRLRGEWFDLSKADIDEIKQTLS